MGVGQIVGMFNNEMRHGVSEVGVNIINMLTRLQAQIAKSRKLARVNKQHFDAANTFREIIDSLRRWVKRPLQVGQTGD